MAEIRVVGDLEVGGERGRVIYPLGMSTAITATEYKDPQKTIKRVDMVAEVITMPGRAEQSRAEQSRAEQSRAEQSSRIIVVGGLGVSARRDRDPDRVLCSRGIVYALPAHIATDKPLVVRKYESDKT